MTNGRRRSSHVRPRPPSSGRTERTRPAAPTTQRVRRDRGLDARRRPLPYPARIVLVLAVVALGGVVFMTASGGLGTLVSAFGSSLSSALARITQTSTPAPSQVVATDSPIILEPAKPYTNQPAVDLEIVIPSDVAGSATATVRIYLTLEGQQPTQIAEVPVGGTTKLRVPVTLTAGSNPFSASIFKGGVESRRSLTVTWILDQDPPKIVLSSPKDGATLSTDTVNIVGKTQPDSTLVARNEANGTSVTGTAASSDGSFAMVLPISAGPNGIHLTATDPAGNATDLVFSVQQGTGRMTATLTASKYLISVSKPPASLQFTVLVTDPAGHPIDGATAFFTIQLPGLAPISSSLTTGGDGRATFTVPINGKLTTGNGVATVSVSSPSYGQTTARAALTFVK